jgi:hypothetical protein
MRHNYFKDILNIFISNYIFHQVYTSWFWKCKNHYTYIYENQSYTAVVKQLNRHELFNVIIPHSYVKGLKYYKKENFEQDMTIFLVKNQTIHTLPKLKPKHMYTLLNLY